MGTAGCVAAVKAKHPDGISCRPGCCLVGVNVSIDRPECPFDEFAIKLQSGMIRIERMVDDY